jgi:hypothetical protein
MSSDVAIILFTWDGDCCRRPSPPFQADSKTWPLAAAAAVAAIAFEAVAAFVVAAVVAAAETSNQLLHSLP